MVGEAESFLYVETVSHKQKNKRPICVHISGQGNPACKTNIMKLQSNLKKKARINEAYKAVA
jgi:hypothetical protein